MTARFPLGTLLEDLRHAALDQTSTEPALVAARLVDGLRDAGLPVPKTEDWNAATAALDEEAWKRLDVVTRLLREGRTREFLVASLRAEPARAWRALPDFCTEEGKLLTAELLVKSPFRVEELARKLVHVLGGSIEGESPAESRQRRERLDYGNVLGNLEAAGKDREERQRKLKEIEARRLREQQEAYARSSRE